MNTLSKGRFITLDVFRGMTVFLMIIVNTQGSGAVPYSQLTHAEWNGCTLTDLVFPSFLFAVGNAMVFANNKMESLPERTVLYKIFRRTFLIFLVGYLLAWYPFISWDGEGRVWFKPINETRIMAVLQRIALAYCLAALIVRYGKVKTVFIISGFLLLAYWVILFFAGDKGTQYAITGNAVRKLDLIAFGEQHMYKEKGVVFDPEGLLSTIPAAVNVLAGYCVGSFILHKGKTYECITKLLVSGTLFVLIAQCWNFYFPINKKLWTSSYVLYTTGIDVIIISLLFYLIEIKQWKTGISFFNVFGRNPLFIYVLSNLLGVLLILYVSKNTIVIDWLNSEIFQAIAPGPMGCLLFSIFFTMLCWLVGWVMDKKKIYIRL